jgi:phosphoribosylformylglycinamidine synthase
LKIAFQNAGDTIVLLDGHNAESPALATRHSPLATSDFAREFSSSEYSKSIAGIVAGEPPAIDLAAEKRLIDCLVDLAAEGSVQSAHDISDGGLAVTLAESCFAASSSAVGAGLAPPILGAAVNLTGDSASPEHALFNERGARAVVSVTPAKLAAVLATARQYNVAAHELGQVTRGDVFRIEYKGSAVIDSSIETLRDAWANSLERTLTAK